MADNLKEAQSVVRRHFAHAQPTFEHDRAAEQQAALTGVDINLQHESAHNLDLGRDFLHPSFYLAGTIPRLHDPEAVLVNGFGLICSQHLIRNDGTADDPTPGDCACGDWQFLAWGCGHVNITYKNSICGATRSSLYNTAKICPHKKGAVHIAKRQVLGPCNVLACTWWAEHDDDIRHLGRWLEAAPNAMVRVWPQTAAERAADR